MIYNVEFTEEPEMDYLADINEKEAETVRAAFAKHGIPCRVEPAGVCDLAGIIEVIEDFVGDNDA